MSDNLKVLENAWLSYQEQILKGNVPEEALPMFKQCFFSAAAVIMKAVTTLGATDVPEVLAIRSLKSIDEEVQKFLNEKGIYTRTVVRHATPDTTPRKN